MSENQLRVGFVGIGRMGTPMSLHLLEAGFPLTVYDRVPACMDPVIARGAAAASSPCEVALRSDVVITMIGQVAEELEAVLGASGVLEGAHRGLVLIDCSTVGIVASKKMAAAAADKGVSFLDATISGSVGPAREKRLTFMVGGEAEVIERVRPVFMAMGERIHHVGPNGAGSAMKAVVNLMIGLTVLTEAETLTLARRAGLDLEQTLEILNETAVASPHLRNKGRMMLARNFEPAFALKYMQKDFDLIMEAAHELHLPLFVSAMAEQLYAAANAAGFGDEDYAAVIKEVEELAGETV